MSSREQLAKLLRARGMTAAELARRLSEQPSWVYDRLRGHSEIVADDIPMLARALGVPCSEFFRGSECPEAREAEGRPLAPRPHIVEAVERQMISSLEALPQPERDLIESMGALLVEYRRRLLAEERGEAEG